MPRKQERHIFSVFLAYSDGRIVMLYLGSSERLAAWHFYRAAQQPGAYRVTLHRDGHEAIRVHIEPTI